MINRKFHPYWFSKHTKFKQVLYVFISLFLSCSAAKLLTEDKKPVFYIIGDSTVRNGDGSGSNQQWGWGSFIHQYFDTTKISIQNHAIGGRSSRTFINDGRWNRIMEKLKTVDYVIMQFGHNDSSPLDDTARARGTIKGIGEESKEIYNPITKQHEVVYTFGHYMRRYVRDTKAKGAIAIVCSPIPRNDWNAGKVQRADGSYGTWSQQIATAEGAYFIDLNNIVAEKYEAMGADAVKAFFPADHTHTDLQGAKLNADLVIAELRKLKPGKLNNYYSK